MRKVQGFITLGVAIGLLAIAGAVSAAATAPVGLGTAAPFAVLAGTPNITSTGATLITGDMGIHPALAVSGFPPGVVIGTIHQGDAVALQAKNDLVTAYNDAAGRTPFTVVPGGVLNGQTLVAGVYNANGNTLSLTGTITLDGQNDPNSVWIFQATSDLITASSSTVAFINGAQPCNVFWQVTSSATLGSGTNFSGTILALTSITMNSGVTLSGRALARNGNVTLINDTISTPVCAVVPPPTPTPVAPTATPTARPSASPSATPTGSPVASPSATPVGSPGASPSAPATGSPSGAPTAQPTAPTSQPATPRPSPTATPVHHQPVLLVTPRPGQTLPPTDTALSGQSRNQGPTFGWILVVLGGLVAMAVGLTFQKRRARR